ncbi:D-glycero-beta-D-manno-heptose 1-phosphate adenylyltransferase [bacterium]|nr:D-glycero-beta-D-manno-heptose 1-phosphate adenylyltransferase [bacterium]
MGQLLKRENIAEFVDKLHQSGKTVVATNGCFDILHVGHVRYLQKTKSFANYSIVLLNSDVSVKSIKGPNRPINNENDRAEILCALSCVDYVVMFDEDSPRNLLDEIKPDIYTKGADYTMETLPEADIMRKNNIRVEFIDFVAGKSTTGIINKMANKGE